MHRFIVGLAIAAVAVLPPSMASAEDQNERTAQHIALAIKNSGQLQHYSIRVKYLNGTAWLLGHVSSDEQIQTAVDLARRMPEVERVVNKLQVERVDAPAEPSVRAASRPSLLGNLAKRLRGESVETSPEPPQIDMVRTTSGQISFPQADTANRDEKSSAGNPADAPVRQPIMRTPAVRQVEARPNIRRLKLASAVRSNEEPRNEPTPAALPQAPPTRVVSMPSAQLEPTAPMSVARHPMPPAGGVLRTPDGRQVQLVPMVRGPNGQLVPIRLARQVPLGQPLQPRNLAPAHRVAMRRMSANYQAGGTGGPEPAQEGVPGAPLPMGAAAGAAGMAPAYYDQPHMPNNAWPSYAAYPNYAAVTYPKQYSPTAWPYIGPFYPYPQVPLGWRKVTLEWDDGWWFLDFDDTH